jgi:hypothetical protein
LPVPARQENKYRELKPNPSRPPSGRKEVSSRNSISIASISLLLGVLSFR